MSNINTKLFELPFKEFQAHLNSEVNSKIIFSGIYGLGKTSFINWYFTETDEKEHWIPVHLLPVNYSILSNEDISEHLKYDIICEMLFLPDVSFEKDVVNSLDSIVVSVSYQIEKLITQLLYKAPKLGKPLKMIIESIDEYVKKHKEAFAKAENNELTAVETYLKKIQEKKGGIYEINNIDQLITNLVPRIKENSNKKLALIIDDLDRLDPHHIFRLLNVFSSQTDNKNLQVPSFGFDKVVFVCDFENVKNIFANRYGENVDFNGYIDKFYSTEIFHYKNEPEVLDKIIGNIAFSTKIVAEDGYSQLLNDEIQLIKQSFNSILKNLYKFKKINLRALLKYNNREIVIPKKTISITSSISICNYEVPTIVLMEILVKHFGNVWKVKKVLKELAKINEIEKMPNLRTHLEFALCLITSNNHQFNKSGYPEGPLSYDIDEKRYQYHVFQKKDLSMPYYASNIVSAYPLGSSVKHSTDKQFNLLYQNTIFDLWLLNVEWLEAKKYF